jgi:dihydroflavonol-4-reductase
MANIIITGGCGFLGQHLIHELLKGGHRLKVIDICRNKYPYYDFKDKVEYILDKDIKNFESIKGAFTDAEIVFHLAGLVSFWRKNKNDLFNVNVGGTANVLKECARANVKRVIQVSSAAAFGYSDDKNNPVNEKFKFDWQKAKKKHYMTSKYLADREVKKYISEGCDCLILHPGLFYGPGDTSNTLNLIKSLKNNEIAFNMPGGTNLIDVRDVAKGLNKAMTKGKKSEQYLLGGDNYSLKKLYKMIAEELNVRPPYIDVPMSMHKPVCFLSWLAETFSIQSMNVPFDLIDSSFRFRYYDSAKAERELGWKNKIPIRKTIQDSIRWLVKEGLV